METLGQNHSLTRIEQSKTINGAKPIFWGGDSTVDLSIYNGTQISPEINLVKLKNVVAIGRSELVLKDGVILYPRPFDPKLYSFSLEKDKKAKVDVQSHRIKILFRSRSLTIERAVSLLGQCNGNYAHWVLEVLAKLAFIDKMPTLDGFPLLIDATQHPTFIDSLSLLNGSNREIIQVRDRQKVNVKQLYHVSSPSFTPPETRTFFETGVIDKPRTEQFQFSTKALTLLREEAVKSASQYVQPSTGPSYRTSQRPIIAPRLVYISRKPETSGNGRHLLNDKYVKALVSKHGFDEIDIGSYAFDEQVMSLQNAKVVVSPIGAACANLVFCPPGLSVVLISPYYAGANWYYWTNFLIAAGHKTHIVLGPQHSIGSGEIYHRDYRVRLQLLEKAILNAKREAGF